MQREIFQGQVSGKGSLDVHIKNTKSLTNKDEKVK